MNGLFQWIYIFALIFVGDAAIEPPPWSDPSRNPCASKPGGWQLLYWAPLKQCFKIYTVIKTHEINIIKSIDVSTYFFLNATNILYVVLSTAWLPMSRHNGINTRHWRQLTLFNWCNSRVPLSTKHGTTSWNNHLLQIIWARPLWYWSIFRSSQWTIQCSDHVCYA